jgi:hypothetical protein
MCRRCRVAKSRVFVTGRLTWNAQAEYVSAAHNAPGREMLAIYALSRARNESSYRLKENFYWIWRRLLIFPHPIYCADTQKSSYTYRRDRSLSDGSPELRTLPHVLIICQNGHTRSMADYWTRLARREVLAVARNCYAAISNVPNKRPYSAQIPKTAGVFVVHQRFVFNAKFPQRTQRC